MLHSLPLVARSFGASHEPRIGAGGIRSSSGSAALGRAATPPWTPLKFAPTCPGYAGDQMTDEGSAEERWASTETFAVAARRQAGWAIIDVKGDLDVYSAPTLRHVITDRIEQGDARIVIDLEHVDFMDSAGLAAMMMGLRLAGDEQGTLVLVQPGDQARRMLKLTNLDSVLHAFPSVEEAVSLGDLE